MARKKLPKSLDFTVKGIAHRVTTSTRRMMLDHLPLFCKLVREPDNLYDRNAIKVVIAEAGNPYDGFHIGYLSKEVAKVYAPLMDADEIHFKDALLVFMDWQDGDADLRVTLEARPPKAKPRKSKSS